MGMEHVQNNPPATRKKVVLQGALAGTIATLPMTLFMLATQRFLPEGQRYDLPPEIITRDLAARVHLKPFLRKRQVLGATLISHFGYGAVAGALYRPLKRKRLILAPVQGLCFGLLVWAVSYLGLLPLLRLSASGPQEPLRRNLMMIAAHVVWGMTLGVITDLLAARKE